MFSFGMAASRAFSIAFWSARFPPGSGPPSRAATMIARVSFENSCPRFASAAPFLRLICAHLLWPDIGVLPDGVEKELVHARIVGQFRMECRDQEATLAKEHRLAPVLGEHLDLHAGLLHARRADEDSPERPLFAGEREIRLEARHLAPVGVSFDRDVEQPQVLPVED